MSTSDDKFIIEKTILNLESHIASLDIEIDEEGSGNSTTLLSVEAILQDALNKLKDKLTNLG
jgi:hypothetical protein